jgi:ankyrin repeat protein
VSRHGNTPLHAAAFQGLVSSLQLLLDLGANRHAKVL